MVKVPHSPIEVCKNLVRNSENIYKTSFMSLRKGMKNTHGNINSLWDMCLI
jgi:hypothetical protein